MQILESDPELLTRYARGADEEAFARLVERHLPLVMGVSRRVVGAAEAEDVAQAVFLVLSAKAAALSGYQQLGGWLHRTATHIALRQRASSLARSQREHAISAEASAAREHAVEEDPDRLDEQSRIGQHLDAAIQQLPATYREAIVLHHCDGIPLPVLAGQLGLTPAALAMRLTRGRQRLQRALQRLGVTPSAAALAGVLAAPAAGLPAAGGAHIAQLAAAFRSDMRTPGRAGELARRHLTHPLVSSWVATLGVLVLLTAGLVLTGWAWQGRAGHRADPPAVAARSQARALDAPPAADHVLAPPAASLANAANAANAAKGLPPGAEGSDPDLVQIAQSAKAESGTQGSGRIQVTEFADLGGHHLFAWKDAPNGVLGTIVSLACSHESVASIANALGQLRSLPIRAATPAVADLVVPDTAITQKTLREVLDAVCLSSGLGWRQTAAGVVIDRLPQPASAND